MKSYTLVAEFERAKIADRMRRGMKHAVIKNNQVLGNKAPYGYRFVRKTDTTPAHWEVDPQEAEIVRLVFGLYVNKRMTGAGIVRHLTAEGFPTKSGTGKWWGSDIYSILENETYLGTAYMFKTRSVEPKKHPKVNHPDHRSGLLKQLQLVRRFLFFTMILNVVSNYFCCHLIT